MLLKFNIDSRRMSLNAESRLHKTELKINWINIKNKIKRKTLILKCVDQRLKLAKIFRLILMKTTQFPRFLFR